MSIALPDIDLSAAVAGSTGTIDLTKVGIGAGGVSANPSTLNNQAQMFLFNESGCALTITFSQTGNSFKMPSGAWTYVPLPLGEYQLKWSVDFLITGAPISLLLMTYYAPGEPIPSQFTLGNSPIGGTVTTGGSPGVANQLINTGNAASASPIIQIAEAGSTGNQVFADNQGNFQINQYVAAVLTQLFRVIAGVSAGNSNVLLSDASHQAEVVGNLLCDKNLTIVGGASGQDGIQAIMPSGSPTAFPNFQSVGPYGSGGNFGFQFTQFGINDTLAIGFQADGSNVTGAGTGNTGLQTKGKVPIGLDYSSAIVSTANGSVSGTLELYTPIWGASFKICFIYMRGLNTATNTIVIFPSAMQSGIIWPGDIGGSTTGQLFNGGTAVGCRQIVYATTGGTAGSSSAQTNFRSCSQFTFLGTVDRVAINTTGGAGVNNGIIIAGF